MLGCGTASTLLRLNPEKVTIENVLLKHDELRCQRTSLGNRRRSLQLITTTATVTRTPSPQLNGTVLGTLNESCYYHYPEHNVIGSNHGSFSSTVRRLVSAQVTWKIGYDVSEILVMTFDNGCVRDNRGEWYSLFMGFDLFGCRHIINHKSCRLERRLQILKVAL